MSARITFLIDGYFYISKAELKFRSFDLALVHLAKWKSSNNNIVSVQECTKCMPNYAVYICQLLSVFQTNKLCLPAAAAAAAEQNINY